MNKAAIAASMIGDPVDPGNDFWRPAFGLNNSEAMTVGGKFARG